MHDLNVLYTRIVANRNDLQIVANTSTNLRGRTAAALFTATLSSHGFRRVATSGAERLGPHELFAPTKCSSHCRTRPSQLHGHRRSTREHRRARLDP